MTTSPRQEEDSDTQSQNIEDTYDEEIKKELQINQIKSQLITSKSFSNRRKYPIHIFEKENDGNKTRRQSLEAEIAIRPTNIMKKQMLKDKISLNNNLLQNISKKPRKTVHFQTGPLIGCPTIISSQEGSKYQPDVANYGLL